MSYDVFDDRLCELGEGPLWHPERQQFFWFDIVSRRLLSCVGAERLAWSFDEHVSAAGWVDRDTLLVASETALLRFDIESGEHETIVPMEAGNALTRSNDGRADPQGGFWIGTMGKAAEKGAGAIYRYYRGVLECLYPAITIPNSIAFAPDGRHAYFTDTTSRQIQVQALDEQGWPAGEPDVFIDLRDEGLNPDGSVVDTQGGLWNAQWGVGRVARYHPDGRFDRAVSVGGRHASCPAFGGANLDRMIVTTAREGLHAPDDRQGAVYAVEVEAQGLAEHRVLI
jgi:sugar lactone lactonase YvrE